MATQTAAAPGCPGSRSAAGSASVVRMSYDGSTMVRDEAECGARPELPGGAIDIRDAACARRGRAPRRRCVGSAVLVLALVGACNGTQGLEPGQPFLDHPRTPLSFATDFESGSLAAWSVEGSTANEISISDDPSGAPNHVASMHVEPGALINGRSRAEIAYDNDDEPGTIAWYRWRFFVPTDYGEPPDTTGKDAQGRPLWQVMGQWHDQPDFAAGETWDSYPGHSPPIAVNYGTMNGQPLVAVAIGVEGHEKDLGPVKLDKGVWHELLWHIGWSTGDDAFVAVWFDGVAMSTLYNGTPDGEPVQLVGGEARIMGRNMYNAVPHYLKLGIYRNDTLAYANTVYYDDIVIAATRDAAEASPTP